LESEACLTLADGDMITVVERTFRYECRETETEAETSTAAVASMGETPKKLTPSSLLSQNVFSVSELASSPHTPQNPSLVRIASTEQTPLDSPQRIAPSPLGSAIVDSEISTSPKLSPRVRMPAEEGSGSGKEGRESSLLASECVTSTDYENPFVFKEVESESVVVEGAVVEEALVEGEDNVVEPIGEVIVEGAVVVEALVEEVVAEETKTVVGSVESMEMTLVEQSTSIDENIEGSMTPVVVSEISQKEENLPEKEVNASTLAPEAPEVEMSVEEVVDVVVGGVKPEYEQNPCESEVGELKEATEVLPTTQEKPTEAELVETVIDNKETEANEVSVEVSSYENVQFVAGEVFDPIDPIETAKTVEAACLAIVEIQVEQSVVEVVEVVKSVSETLIDSVPEASSESVPEASSESVPEALNNNEHVVEVSVDIDVSETTSTAGIDSKPATPLRAASESTPVRRSARKRATESTLQTPAKRNRSNALDTQNDENENENEQEIDASTPTRGMRRSSRTRVMEKSD
jgi:hypothetical protein